MSSWEFLRCFLDAGEFLRADFKSLSPLLLFLDDVGGASGAAAFSGL